MSTLPVQAVDEAQVDLPKLDTVISTASRAPSGIARPVVPALPETSGRNLQVVRGPYSQFGPNPPLRLTFISAQVSSTLTCHSHPKDVHNSAKLSVASRTSSEMVPVIISTPRHLHQYPCIPTSIYCRPDVMYSSTLPRVNPSTRPIQDQRLERLLVERRQLPVCSPVVAMMRL
jgi:hypothetical protein